MTTNRLKPKMVILSFLAAATICGAVFLAQGFFVGAGDFGGDDFKAGKAATSGSSESDHDILIAKVGESGISLADLKEEKSHSAHMSTLSQRELDGLGPNTGSPGKYLQAMHGVVTKWGVETASISKLVQDRALFEAARDLGVAATEAEVAENQAMSRKAYDNGEFDEYNKGYVLSVGEDAYWNDVYPGKARLLLSIGKLRRHVEEEGGETSYHNSKTLWVDFTGAVIAEADILLPESEYHSTTVEDIQDYLSDVRAVQLESLLAPQEHLETTPEGTWVVYAMAQDGTVEKTEIHEAAIVCYDEDEEGNVTRWVCDAATEKVKIADIGDAVLYMIVEPGSPLPVFEE